jgi:hypothetical protein
MADEKPPEEPAPTFKERVQASEGFGCFVLLLVALVLFGVCQLFAIAGPGGAVGAGIAAAGIALMALGIVWVAARYRP